MRKSVFYVSLALVLSAYGALLWAPAAALAGAKGGLAVCGAVILPSLLPFLILSALMVGLGLPETLGRYCGPLFQWLFGVSGAGAAPFLLGLTGGYPVGAAAVAELLRRGDLDVEGAERLLPFCNNTGPAFLIGVAGSGVFGSTAVGLLLYLSHILAAVGVGVLGSLGVARQKHVGAVERPATEQKRENLARLLPESVKSAVGTGLNICGYVVFFSVVIALLDALGVFSGAAGALSWRLGIELHAARALLAGVLELGTGISTMKGLRATPGNLALASFLLGFGGLSVHCQTLAAVSLSGLAAPVRLKRHFFGRLLHGLLSAGITCALTTLWHVG